MAWCSLTLMEFIRIPNCSLLYLHSNDMKFLKNTHICAHSTWFTKNMLKMNHMVNYRFVSPLHASRLVYTSKIVKSFTSGLTSKRAASKKFKKFLTLQLLPWTVSSWPLLLFLETFLREERCKTPTLAWNISESLPSWERRRSWMDFLLKICCRYGNM